MHTIHLDQFLKTCGISTGGQAKLLIQNGDVTVNGQVETRRRRQLKAGDEICFGSEVFLVETVETPPSESARTEDQRPATGPRLECMDIGANLTHKSFAKDLESVIADARAAGVSQFIVTGSSVATSRQALELCRQFPQGCYSTAGVHPHDAASCNEQTWSQLETLLQVPTTVAVGECGLDFNRNSSPPAAQQSCFEQHLQLAAQIGKPLFLHERDAFELFYEMLKRHRDHIGDAVVHCFTGSATTLDAYLDLDLHIGITGWICDERRGTHLRELVRRIPATRLMIETDSPYLAPRDIRPRVHRNEPRFLPHILQAIAACRAEPPEELGRQIIATTKSFFGI